MTARYRSADTYTLAEMYDVVTGCSYYGMAFLEAIGKDPAAMQGMRAMCAALGQSDVLRAKGMIPKEDVTELQAELRRIEEGYVGKIDPARQARAREILAELGAL